MEDKKKLLSWQTDSSLTLLPDNKLQALLPPGS
jgi:hypothetical protein